MPRVELEARERYPFGCEVRVRVYDLNYGGHLDNARLLALCHEARVAFLASRGWTEADCGGASLIMGDAAVVYQGEAFGGDVLRCEVAAGEPGRCGFRLFYRLTRRADGAPVALAEQGLVAFDYGTRRIRPLPQAVRTACADPAPPPAREP